VHSHHAIESVSTTLIVCIILNLLFVIAEAVIGFSYHSLGLLSDAGHNLSDIFSLLLSLFAIRMATRKGNRHFTYGYKKSKSIPVSKEIQSNNS
jgi:cobalt-zinc-cadmium efflux system protein